MPTTFIGPRYHWSDLWVRVSLTKNLFHVWIYLQLVGHQLLIFNVGPCCSKLSAYQISFYKYTELDLELNMNVFLIPSESISESFQRMLHLIAFSMNCAFPLRGRLFSRNQTNIGIIAKMLESIKNILIGCVFIM